MKSFGWMATLLVCALAGAPAFAQQASAPAGSTGQCNDGTYTDHNGKRGACAGHKGVKEWYTAAAAPAAGAAPAAAAPTPAPAPAAAPAPAPKVAATPHAPAAPAGAAAPGGGPGMVWANDSSKVYHCPSDKWYGKTKKGEYMSESDAKAKGFHADHGKACS